MTPAIISFRSASHAMASRVAEAISGEFIPCSPQDLKATVSDIFLSRRPLIGVFASGVLIRLLAPLLDDKQRESAVVCLSDDGASVVPLIGGHHGANELARRIAEATGGHASITTASDVHFGADLESPDGYVLANPHDLKPFVSALLDGAAVRAPHDTPWLGSIPRSDESPLEIIISEMAAPGDPQRLVYHPRTLALGLGCVRGANPRELIELVDDAISRHNLAKESIACAASIDLKIDEPAILEVARHLCVPIRFFTAAELNEEASRLRNPSPVVLEEIGCPGVSEGAALRAAGPSGELIVEKTKAGRATCAVARAPSPIVVNSLGRKRGRLSVVGLGPGSAEWMSPAARSALRQANDWVGYSLYLDLVRGISDGQHQHSFALGEEEARVRHALDLALGGKDVALVCSGDAGIYAMASLVFERAEARNLSGSMNIDVIPGISAFQAASARAGAMIGHDFCAISLSDLLTPWPVIRSRVSAAAEGDFVIAFYNPRSGKRQAQFEEAIDLVAKHRTPTTPVVIASNLGRPQERVRIVPLSKLDASEIDMLTVVLIGSTASRHFVGADGRGWAYTPRDYARKTGAPS
jgi:cobalt-precorrin 5A hydrolase/precorrin-3B C17-methyltransferase